MITYRNSDTSGFYTYQFLKHAKEYIVLRKKMILNLSAE